MLILDYTQKTFENTSLEPFLYNSLKAKGDIECSDVIFLAVL